MGSTESFFGWEAVTVPFGQPIYEADGPPRIIIADSTDAGVVILRQVHPEAADGDGVAYAKRLRMIRLARNTGHTNRAGRRQKFA